MVGKRPPNGVYLSMLGEVRTPAPCILIAPSTDLDARCLAGLDVIVVCAWPAGQREMDLIERVANARPLNLDILDPVLRLRVGYICSGAYFLTQQPFNWGME